MTAISAVPDITPEYLREQAAKCRAESEAARERAKSLLAEAFRLEREAEALAAVWSIPSPVAAPSERAVLAGEVSAHLNHHATRQGKASSELAELFGVSQEAMRSALALAVECGFVKRTGLNRGTRYWAADKAPETPDPFGRRWHERVRDAGIKLGCFTLAELGAEMPDVSGATLRRWAAQLVDDGTFEVARVGNANVYAYVTPEAPEPVKRDGGNGANGGKSRRDRAVAGTGRSKRANRREVRDIIKTVEEQGATVKPVKHGYLIERDGDVITAVPKTASDHRSLKNATADIKRGGLDA